MITFPQIKKLFKDKSLLDLALTHRSWINENKHGRETNERLEFLGDAVLEFVVSNELYQRFPKKPEGFLTALRANLVNTTNLANFAKTIELGKEIYLSKGEVEGNGRNNPSILADSVEALIGALYRDGGTEAAYSFITQNLLANLDEKLKEPLKDPKSSLQELVQAQGEITPKYKVVSETGPDHNKTFVVEVVVGGKVLATNKGKSKSIAEQEAATAALKKLSE